MRWLMSVVAVLMLATASVGGAVRAGTASAPGTSGTLTAAFEELPLPPPPQAETRIASASATTARGANRRGCTTPEARRES